MHTQAHARTTTRRHGAARGARNPRVDLPKETDDLLDLCRAAGWEVTRTKSRHWKCVSPDGQTVTTSGTPSDWRSVKNFRASLKRAGLRPPERKRPLDLPVLSMPAPPPPQEQPAMMSLDSHNGHAEHATQPAAASAPSTGTRGGTNSSPLRDAVLKAVRSLDKGQGVSPEDMTDTVRFNCPTATRESIRSSLPMYAAQEYLKRVSRGLYSLGPKADDATAASAARKPRLERMKPLALTGDMGLDQDMKKLEDALMKLAKLPDLVAEAIADISATLNKYQGIIHEAHKLKRMLGVTGNN